MMNRRLSPWIHNTLTVLAWRIVLIYVLLFVLRVIFYLFNTDTLGSMTWAEVPALLRGSGSLFFAPPASCTNVSTLYT